MARRPLDKQTGTVALFHLDISMDGLINLTEAPLNPRPESFVQEYEHSKRILGKMTVFSDGIILPLREKGGVQKYKATLFLGKKTPYPYIEFENGSTVKIDRIGSVAHYHGVVRHNHAMEESMEPHYTLDGFYAANGLSTVDEKLEWLGGFIEERERGYPEADRFRAGSNKRPLLTRLREAENRFRRTVSDR